ncbi:MAG TPA: hypothetical protein VHE53_02415 [Patescibacteria group bacterium]|nr:hypothetical protein [Patescibacteria group bacterium]
MEIPVNPNEKKKGLGNKLKISGLGLVVLAFLGIIALGASQTSISTQTATVAQAQTPQCASGDKTVEKPDEGKPVIAVKVESGCRVKGDVQVGEFATSTMQDAYHDKDAKDASKDLKAGKEGNILECPDPDGCTILARFGANIAHDSYDTLVKQMKGNGCKDNKGCNSIIHWCFTGGKLMELKDKQTCTSADHDDGGATATPTTTPAPSSTPQATKTPQATATSVPSETPSPKKDDKSNKAPTNPTPGKPIQMGSLDKVPVDGYPGDNGGPCEKNLLRGAMYKVQAGCIISGDVVIAPTLDDLKKCSRYAGDTVEKSAPCVYHDNNPLTGAIVLMKEDGVVLAPWGASIHSPGTDAVATVWAMKVDMSGSGCGTSIFANGDEITGCPERVTTYSYPNKKPIPDDPNIVRNDN